VNGRGYDLGTNRYPGVVHPQGFQFLTQFRLDPFPIFTFRVEGVEIEKKLFMVHGQNTTVTKYELINAPSAVRVQLELRPLIAFRDYHNLTHENRTIDGRVDIQRELISVSPYGGLPSLYFANDAAQTESTGHWYRNFEYEAERERGLDFQEDLFNPRVLRFDLNQRPTATLIASTETRKVDAAELFEQDEIVRRRQITKTRASQKRFHNLTDYRCRSVHRFSRRSEEHHRRISLVQRLGPRCHDRASLAHASHWTLRYCTKHSAYVCATC